MYLTEEQIERFLNKFTQTDDSSCWDWKGTDNGKGYGDFNCNNKSYRAHRVSYEFFNKTIIPHRMVVDHLCRNRKCVNPKHLEVVSHYENTMRGIGHAAKNARKDSCKHGHAYNSRNTHIRRSKNGRVWRVCKECKNRIQREYYKRKSKLSCTSQPNNEK